jgi:hypothetical protein
MIVCEIAKAFNARGICDGSRWPVAGGRWHATTVQNILDRG